MTILQIECFLAAAKYQSYSAAAAELYVSQPTFSRQIQSLEDELSVTLFVRSNNMMLLTPVGRKLLPELEYLFQNFRSTGEKLKEIASSYSGRLRIGIQSGLGVDLRVRTACQYIMDRRPTATVMVSHQPQKNSHVALSSGTIDLLVALSPTIPETSKFDSLLLYRDYMCLAVPADHKNANLPSIAHEDVNRYFPELKLFCVDSTEFDAPLQPLERHSSDDISNRIISLTGPYATADTLMMMVDSGMGMAMFPSRSILSSNQNVRLIPLTPPVSEPARGPEKLEVRLYWQVQNLNPIHLEYLAYLRSLMAQDDR